MEHCADHALIIDLTPVDLWRMGTATSPKFDKIRVPPHPRPDLPAREVDGVTMVSPRKGGLSLFDNINPQLQGGVWWVIPQDTAIPAGLGLTRERVSGRFDYHHYTVHPTREMSLEEFIKLLAELGRFALRHAVPPRVP